MVVGIHFSNSVPNDDFGTISIILVCYETITWCVDPSEAIRTRWSCRFAIGWYFSWGILRYKQLLWSSVNDHCNVEVEFLFFCLFCVDADVVVVAKLWNVWCRVWIGTFNQVACICYWICSYWSSGGVSPLEKDVHSASVRLNNDFKKLVSTSRPDRTINQSPSDRIDL